MEAYEKVEDALSNIPLSMVDRQTWIDVGMALKSEGFSCAVWDQWSQTDPARYHEGECEKLWNGFNGDGINIGKLYQHAQFYGWTYKQPRNDDWDKIIDTSLLDLDDVDEVISAHSNVQEPWQMAATYLEKIFKADEHVSFVTDVRLDQDGKWKPASAGRTKTAGQMIEELNRYKDIGAVIGDWNEEAGAWIRFNPTDGNGASNSNITRYTYTLVESDTMSLEDQKKTLVRLHLPITCLVSSGSKSLHAIVRVDADNPEQYRQRVKQLYDVLGKNGMQVDKQNSNSARLSRFPGVSRKGKIQELLATDMGARSWDDWVDFMAGIDDDLPPLVTAEEMIESPQPMPPILIDGVLHKGCKMIVTGDSKSGKTCLLMNLAICISEGWKWLGHQCMPGKVLYINLEIIQPVFEKRYLDIYKRRNATPSAQAKKNFVAWNLRGKATTLKKLAPKIIRRCRNQNYLAIIVDPIYKVLSGDENSAETISEFCSLFDHIAEETGATRIYAHHHAKGYQGNRKAMDRGSGSGVFSRDADAILDITNLVLDPNAKDVLTDPNLIPLQLEMILRAFPFQEPIRMIYEYPLHRIDDEHVLDRSAVEGTPEASRLLSPNVGASDLQKQQIADACFDACVRQDGTARFADMYNLPECPVKRDALRRYVLASGYEIDNGVVTKCYE